MKFFNFNDWIDATCEIYHISAGDIISRNDEYEVKIEGDLVAYWDRKYKFGYVSVIDAE